MLLPKNFTVSMITMENETYLYDDFTIQQNRRQQWNLLIFAEENVKRIKNH